MSGTDHSKFENQQPKSPESQSNPNSSVDLSKPSDSKFSSPPVPNLILLILCPQFSYLMEQSH